MYYPILRGKLNELLALRELANLPIDKKFCPIIEPVKHTLAPLFKTLRELNDKEITPLILINPSVGELVDKSDYILENLHNESGLRYIPIIAVKDNIEELDTLISKLNGNSYALFLLDGLSSEILARSVNAQLTFVNSDTSPNLIKKLEKVVLYGDFFKKQKRNADYSDESPFSSLHTYFQDIERVVGFGDYTIISEEYNESGGPAYVVTIHITYINGNKFDEAFVRHYSSKTDIDKPNNPGKKFLEALSQVVEDKKNGKITFFDSFSFAQFQKIYETKHFPGLGQVKKISIMHHIETINDYLLNK